ncbi:MAG TPA: 30S ribosomal protein S16 [Candidatus Polarisedimenticolaceae bacterium]|nr:30S ribosomal protein S16 [Candidatus Polarisedimenticolaceae bacterium]
MLKIRLRRMGSRQDPFYRVVVSDSQRTPQGRFVENLGTYNPGTQPETVQLDVEKAQAWIKKGAHPSETVRSLLVKAQKAKSAGASV